MSCINLLPDSYVATERHRRAARSLITGMIVVVLVCAAWSMLAYTQIRALSMRMATAQDRLAFEDDRSRALEAKRAAGHALRALLAHRDQLEAPVPAPGVLSLLTQLLPESVAVTRLVMTLPPADLTDYGRPQAQGGAAQLPPPPASTRVEMDGVAVSDVELAKVVGTLASHKAFTNVKLLRSRQVMTQGLTRFAFEITLEVPAAAPAPGRSIASTVENDAHGG